MKLLEREIYFSELNELFKKAANGTGNIAAVCGEAGIGKTSLIESFTEDIKGRANILQGSCDDLFTHQPLAPLYDIAVDLQKGIIKQLDSGVPRPSVFAYFFEELKRKEPNVIIIEDVHWADEATLDLIKYLGRRIKRSKSLLIISYRDDEVYTDHPLSVTFSSILSVYFKRIKLLPLSMKAVSLLTGSYGKYSDNIYEQTGGNPFFVTEILSNNENNIPGTIKDLINSKLFRLPEQSRRAVELISVIPNRTEKWLLKELVKDFSVLDKPFQYELLKADNDYISFRHELARLSVEESLPESERINLNSKVLKVLLNQKNKNHFFARIVHHAEKAQDREAIVKFAPLAAKQASGFGAHKQAAEHYLTVLKYPDQLSIEEQLDLLQGLSYECYLTGQIEKGVEACKSVIKILKDHPDLYREGESFRMLARLQWYGGEDNKGEEYLKKAISILEKLPPDNDLAMAYSNLSQMYMCREEFEPAIEWGEKAIHLAKQINYPEAEIHSLNNIGTAKMFAEDSSGEYYLKKSLELSLEKDLHDNVSRAYVNLGSAYLYRRNLSEAINYFSAGIEYCSEKDLESHELCITAEMSKTKLLLGKWDEAAETAGMIFRRDNIPVIDRVISSCVIGLIRARRNDPGALDILNKADIMAVNSGETGKIVTVKAAKAEMFWLQNKLEDIVEEVLFVYEKIIYGSNPWATGEIAFWLWKADKLKTIPEKIAEPYLHQIKGNWKKAARIWERLHCPYEHALALADGDESASKKALEIFDSLGANATSQLIKRKMRESGIKKIPVGPRKSTKENPEGLTKRQTEVLVLLSKGLSNTDIADNLFISPKTVDHHISAIFSKLNIHSRTEAAAFAHSKNLTVI